MKKEALFLSAMILVGNVFSQPTFQFRYGNAYANAGKKVIQVYDGNFIVAGNTRNPAAGTDVFLMKINTAGSVLWQKNYTGSTTDSLLDLIQLPNKHLVFCGSTRSYGAGDSDGFITEADSAGNLIWSKRYGVPIGDEYFTTLSLAPGGFYVSGRDTTADLKLLLKLNSSGNIVWAKQWNPISSELSHHITLTNNGVYFAASSSSADIISYKFDQAGSLLWSRQYTSSPATIVFNALYSLSLVEGNNGNLIFATAFSNSLTYSGNDQVVLVVDSASGNQIWSKSYGASGHEEIQKIIKANDGTYVFVSKIVSNGVYLIGMVKINSVGNVLWSHTYPIQYFFDVPSDLKQTSGNGFIFTGVSRRPFDGDIDSAKVYLCLTDSLGVSCSSQTGTLVTANQSFSLTTPPSPNTFTCPVNSFTWTVNNQTFGPRNICSTVGIEELNTVSFSAPFPNPTSGKFTLKNLRGENLDIEIYNSLGQPIKRIAVDNAENNIEIDIHATPEGVYKMIIKSPGYYQTFTIVKVQH